MSILVFALFALSVPFIVSAQEGITLLTGEDGPFSTVVGASDLPAFLNQIYLLCIGIAVVVSILQIIRGGITWMLTDSVMEKGQAKHLVTIAIMGLLLVLSPVIVFNIINPCILSLSLSGTEECEGSIGDLKPGQTPPPVETPERVESVGEYVRYARLPDNEIGTFKNSHCINAFYEDEREITSTQNEVVCNYKFAANTFFVCNRSDGLCQIKGAVALEDAPKIQKFISECSAGTGTETRIGVGASTEPISSVRNNIFYSCNDTDKATYESRFGGVPADKDVVCLNPNYYCKFR